MKRSKKITAGFVLVGVMLVSSIAYAAWTATGTGSGFAKASTAQSLGTVDVSASTSATLFPGATGDVSLRINNPNPYPVRVTAVSGAGTIDSDKTAACDASTGVTFTDQTGLTLDIPASSAQTFTLSGSVSMSNSSHTDCQGAVFTIPVNLTGASNA
ncbi:MAG TPA: hypothetical protein VI341_09985 [Actinomycetota bacterium]